MIHSFAIRHAQRRIEAKGRHVTFYFTSLRRGRDQSLQVAQQDSKMHFHASLTHSTHMVTFVSIETRRCAPLAALFCSSHFFASACLLQPKIRRYFLHSILIWTLLQPTSSNYSHTYITSMAVTSSKFAKNSGELRHSFCGAFLCLLFAFLQVESVGRWVDRGQCHCSTHVAGYSPLSPFINTLTCYLSSFPLTTMLAQRKSRSRRQSRRFSPNHKSRSLQ